MNAQVTLNTEILNQLKIQDEKIDKLTTCVAVLSDRFKTHTDEDHKEVTKLLGLFEQGKGMVKVLSVLAAGVVGLASAWDWILAHIRF